MAITRYTVQGGDTIHQIARRLLGHADQWWVLAEFNQLDYPYVDPSGPTYPGKRVLVLGDVLLVPTDPDADSTKRVSLTLDPDPYTVVCGTDLLMTDLGDVQANLGTGDWSVISGIDNLMQALQHRLATRKGELAYHPDYGCHLEQHVGTVLDDARVQLVRLEIMQTILADPRIKAIAQVVLADGFDHLDVQAGAIVIGMDDVVPLNLVVPKVGV